MNIKVIVDDTSMLIGYKTYKLANKRAIQNTLNKAAAVTSKESKKQLDRNFVLRNTFTVRSVVYDKATQNEISQMFSRVGALKRASYLKTQEEGGPKRARARGGAIEGPVKADSAVPMLASRDYSGSKPVSTLHYVTKIKRQTVGRGAMMSKLRTPKARSVAQMYIGKKYNIYVKRNNDIFKVKSFQKTGKDSVHAQLEHMYTIHYGHIQITKHVWLEPSYKKASRNLEAVYKWELKKLWAEGNIK